MKKCIAVILALALIWAAAAAVDLVRVVDFEKPVIAQPDAAADDGGSGWYLGPGWSVYIEGDFLPDAEFPGISYFEFYILGQMVNSAIRN